MNDKKMGMNLGTYDLPCPESYLLQSKSNMLRWLVWVNITPSVVAWMLCTLEVPVDGFELGIVREIGFVHAFFLLVQSLNRCGILGAVSVVIL
jgi:hypothetical protein